MKKHLTSKLTVFYKIVFPTAWTLLIVGLIIFIYIDSNDPKTFAIALMWLPMLLPIRIKEISYDEESIYVYNWRTTKVYDLSDIKAINEGNIMSLDPFFEMEIREKDGSIKKIDFMPKVSEQLTFLFTKKYTGHLYDLKNKMLASRGS